MEKIQKESASDNLFSFKITNNASLEIYYRDKRQYGTPGKYWIY